MVLSLGGYWLYNENQTLKENNVKLEGAVAEQKAAIAAITENFERQTKSLGNLQRNYNQIEQNLSAFSVAAKAITSRRKQNDFYHLLKLDIKNRVVNVKSFPKEEFEKANKEYTLMERKYSKKEGFEIVLVSTESVKELQSAFPNYFLDTKEFLNNMELIKKEYNKLK